MSEPLMILTAGLGIATAGSVVWSLILKADLALMTLDRDAFAEDLQEKSQQLLAAEATNLRLQREADKIQDQRTAAGRKSAALRSARALEKKREAAETTLAAVGSSAFRPRDEVVGEVRERRAAQQTPA